MSSGIPSRHFVMYLKQQVQADSRVYDTVRKAEEEHSSILNTDDGTPPSNKHYLDYFKAIKETLLKKQDKPRDEKIRALLCDYYTMVQGRDETVPQFAHRFLEVQHSLEKLIPNIHCTPDQQDTELQHAFLIKLRPPIAKHLVSRDFDFTSLQSVIDVAEGYDSQFLSSIPNNRARYADPFREDKAMLKFPSGTSNTIPPKCFSCGKIGHLKKDCKSTPLGRSNSSSNASNDTKKKSDVCYFYRHIHKLESLF